MMGDKRSMKSAITPHVDSSLNVPQSLVGLTLLIHENNTLRQQYSIVSEQLKSLHLQIHRQQVRFEEELRKTISALPIINGKPIGQVINLKDEMDNLKEENDHVKEDNHHFKEEIDGLQKEDDELKEQIYNLKQENEYFKQRNRQLEQESQRFEQEFRRFEQENRYLKQDIDRFTQENQHLKNV